MSLKDIPCSGNTDGRFHLHMKAWFSLGFLILKQNFVPSHIFLVNKFVNSVHNMFRNRGWQSFRCNEDDCGLILQLKATCSLAFVTQVLQGLRSSPAKAACSQLIAGTHLGRNRLPATHSLPSTQWYGLNTGHPAYLILFTNIFCK